VVPSAKEIGGTPHFTEVDRGIDGFAPGPFAGGQRVEDIPLYADDAENDREGEATPSLRKPGGRS